MKGGADPLLSQEPASVLPSYASLMDTDVGHDFSEDKLMNSGNLYSLYLLNSDSSSEQLKTSENLLETSLSSAAASKDTKKDNGDTDEEIDVETDGVKDPSPEKVFENGHYDALFEGMPFTELKGKEVGRYLVHYESHCRECDCLVLNQLLVTTVLVSYVFSDIETHMGQFGTGEKSHINRCVVSSKLVLTGVDCKDA